jgi:hypothetical protein
MAARRAASRRAPPLAALAALQLLLVSLLAAPRGAAAFGLTSVVALIVANVTTPFPGAAVTIVEVSCPPRCCTRACARVPRARCAMRGAAHGADTARRVAKLCACRAPP